MTDDPRNDNDAIPVLSDVVIPGSTPAAAAPTPDIDRQRLAEHLNRQAAALLAEMEQRIEQMVEEELARAHDSALETARLALQHRLHEELEARLSQMIRDLLDRQP